jgi:hypothetical protein
MKYLGSILILCALAAAAPARAFDVEGDKASLQDPDAQFASSMQTANPDYMQGSSLATPFVGRTDSEFVSDYGNGISIPAPGIDKPAPAWALTPSYSAATALAPVH